MICIYDALCTDFSTNGIGPLSPASCMVYETLNGRWEIKMEHPIDEWDKWTRLKENRILRVPVPAGMTPRVEMADISAGAEIWKVDTNTSRLHLRSGPGTRYSILGRYKKGTEIIVLDTSNADWYEVTAPDGKRGYMYADYLAYVRTEPGAAAVTGVVEARQLRDQPFRIYRIIPTLKGFTVYARHLFYDLLDNMIVDCRPGRNASGARAFAAISSACESEHGFAFYSDLTSAADDFEVCNVNPVDAILGEGGAAEKYGGELGRDWYDVYLVERIGRDAGVQVREGKNLTAIEYDEDITNAATRIMPTGTDADGNILYLPELYIDSEHIDAYAHPKWLHLPVAEAREVTSGDDKRSREECYEIMRAAVREKLEAGCDLPDVTLKIDFVNLADTEEYADFAVLQTICMGDTVHVYSRVLDGYAGIRMVESEYDALKKKYTKMTLGSPAATIADSGISVRQIAGGSITGSKLAINSVGSGQMQAGSVGSMQIGMAAINIAHIAAAAINQLNAEAITAITGRFNEIAAGSITTDELYAAIAKIMALEVGSITADNIETDALAAVLGEFVKVYAEYAGIDFATIKDLTAEEFIFRLGVAGELYIDRLAVTSANIVAAVLGDLVLKGEDGGYYRLHVQADGTITTEQIEVTEGEIASGTTSGGQTIIETTANIRDLNAQTIKASSAIITEIFTDALTAGSITAGQAMIASATIPELSATVIKAIGDSLDLSANTTIQLLLRHDDELRAWFTFSEDGLRTGKVGSTYNTVTDETGFHIEQLNERIGSFAKRTLHTEAVRVGRVNTTEPRIVLREAPDGGAMFILEEVEL